MLAVANGTTVNTAYLLVGCVAGIVAASVGLTVLWSKMRKWQTTRETQATAAFDAVIDARISKELTGIKDSLSANGGHTGSIGDAALRIEDKMTAVADTNAFAKRIESKTDDIARRMGAMEHGMGGHEMIEIAKRIETKVDDARLLAADAVAHATRAAQQLADHIVAHLGMGGLVEAEPPHPPKP
jgi:hypothetical protein